jgi:hypothetical protein
MDLEATETIFYPTPNDCKYMIYIFVACYQD